MATAQTNNLFPDWLTQSKVTPIVQQVELLSRPALTARLNSALGSSLMLLHAPAGYGKSTLLADWCRTLTDDGAGGIAWLSLDSDDNDPFQLVLYFAFSLSVAGVRFAENDIDGKPVFSDLSVRRFLNIVHAAIERHQRKVVLVLDDFEHLAAEVVAAVVEPFIHYAPPNLHIAVASRRDRTLKIADMELRGVAQRLGADELKFSLDEMLEFLAPEIDARSIREVYTITEGWPVAVQLLRSALKGARDIKQILGQLTADNRKIAAYLSEQVVDDLSGEAQTFLMDMSIVGRFDPDFGDFIRERDNSAELLAGLKDLDALVTPVDRGSYSYRLHPMFRDFLRHRLMVADPGRARLLNVRAGRWFDGRGDLIKAVRHSVDGGDAEGAGRYIEAAGGLMLWLKEGLSRLPRALALLDEATVRGRPRLALIECMLMMKTGRQFQARRMFEATVEGLPREAGDDQRLAHELMIIQGLIHAYEGQRPSDRLFETLETTTAEIPYSERALLGHHYTMLCGLNSFRGRPSQARDYAQRGIRCFGSMNSIYGETYLHIHLGDVSYCEGLAAEAEEHYKTALGFIRTYFNDDKAIKLIVDVLQAELRYDANRLDLIPRSADLFPRQLHKLEAWFNIFAAAYLLSSNVAFSRSGLSAALSILESLKGIAVSHRLAGLENLIACQRAALLQRADPDECAASVFAEAGLSVDQYAGRSGHNVGWRERDIATQTMMRMSIRQNRASQAVTHPDRFLHLGGGLSLNRSCITNHILRALAYRQLAQEERAVEDLGRALELAAGARNVRAFLDEGHDLLDLLDLYIDRGSGAAQSAGRIEYARHIREQAGRNERQGLCLTTRELQVLRELEHGYPNKIIARNIGISHNTVRYHLKNIFSKLNVDTRLQAVGAARRANLV